MNEQNTNQSQERNAQAQIIEQVLESSVVRTVAIVMATVSFLVWHYSTVVLPLQSVSAKLEVFEGKLDEQTNQLATIISTNQLSHIETDRKIILLTRNQDKLCDAVKLQCLEVK